MMNNPRFDRENSVQDVSALNNMFESTLLEAGEEESQGEEDEDECYDGEYQQEEVTPTQR